MRTKHPRDGYIIVTVSKVQYLAHRIAWLLYHGTWPTKFIDHINGNRSDNRIENLREADSSINAQNVRVARCRSGLLGVRIRKGRYEANISVGQRSIYLGRFDTAEEAHSAYVNKKREIHAGCTI